MTTPVTTPSFQSRMLVAVAVGLAALLVTYGYLHYAQPHTLGFDFTWPWRGARALLAGLNPYTTVRTSGVFPFDGNLLYPLPAVFVALPFAGLQPDAAAAAFSGISAGLLAFGLSADGFGRFPIFLSPAFIVTACSGQWSTLMMAAAVLPAVSWLAVCKPTVGGAAFLARPNWIAVAVGLALLILSFIVLPTWVADWRENIRLQPGHRYAAPWQVMHGGGPLLLLSALRWRRWEGRWLFVLAVAPQVLTMYSAFPPMLVARTRREALILAALSSVAWFGAEIVRQGADAVRASEPIMEGYWIVPLVFLPALVMVLRRPNRA